MIRHTPDDRQQSRTWASKPKDDMRHGATIAGRHDLSDGEHQDAKSYGSSWDYDIGYQA